MREVPAAEWDELLAQLGCADAYLLHAYVEASCVLDPGEPVLLEDDGVVMACIVRAIPGTDAYDVTTPYGYGGPVGNGDFQQAYERWCGERGIVSTFIRFHPLFENYRGAPHASYASPTVGWPLEGDLLAGHARQAPERRPQGAEGGRRRRRDRRARRPLRVRIALRADDASARTQPRTTSSRPSTGSG